MHILQDEERALLAGECYIFHADILLVVFLCEEKDVSLQLVSKI